VQGLDRYAYTDNNPIRFADPSGHCSTDGDDWCHHTDTGGVWHIYNGPCANNAICTRTRGTFARAGINYQTTFGYARWPFSMEKKDDKFDSVGPAQITDYEMENPYGDSTLEGGHEQTGLGLRDGPCNGCKMNQMNGNVAMLANEVRLTLRLDVCAENGCTSTDKVIVAAFSIDEKVNVNTISQAFTNKKFRLDNPTTTTAVDWKYFIQDQMGAKDYNDNIRLIHRFTQMLQDLNNDRNGGYVPSDVDWNYLTNTVK
jgi:hypothetical protein